MPDQTNRQKRRCLFCGRPFVASDEASEACDECRTLELQHAKQRSAVSATMAAQGKSSSSDGIPITPPASYLPAKTKWHSPPFVSRVTGAKEPDRPARPRPKWPWRLLMLIRYNFEAAAFMILVAGVLLFIRYGIPKSFRLPGGNLFARQPAISRQDAAQQQRNAALRQKSGANLREGPQNWRAGDAELRQERDAKLRHQ